MNNHNNSVRNNQAFYRDALNKAFWLGGSTPALFVPDVLSEKFTPARQRMFMFMVRGFNNHHRGFKISIAVIARAGGVAYKAAGNFVRLLVKMNILKYASGKRAHDYNTYFLGDVLKMPSVRFALRNVFTSLTRAYFKMLEALKGMSSVVEKSLDKPNDLRIISINVFKKNNTSEGDYREIKLHTAPYIENYREYQNMKIALWNNWSLSEDDYRRELEKSMTEEEYALFYKKSGHTDEEVKRKIQVQAQQQRFNRNKYPNDMASKQPYYDPFYVPKPKPEPVVYKISNPLDIDQAILKCTHEPLLSVRLAMLEELMKDVHAASRGYIQVLINKTKKKIHDSL